MSELVVDAGALTPEARVALVEVYRFLLSLKRRAAEESDPGRMIPSAAGDARSPDERSDGGSIVQC